MAVTYAQAKVAVADEGLPTSAGSGWTGVDAGSYDKFAAAASYRGGVPFDRNKSQYGFAYPGEMPAAIANEIGADNYTITIAATPLTGVHPVSVTATATETNATASNYAWDFGDGTAVQNTTVPTANHSYAAAGSFTVKCTPTVGGVVKAQVSAPAPVVLS